MKIPRAMAIVAVLAVALACFAGTANAGPMTCVVPTSVVLDVLPAGCEAVLTNGPITFTGVHDGDGHFHNVEVDSLVMYGMNIASTSAKLSVTGVDRDLTAGTTMSFISPTITDTFETIPTDNTYLPDTGLHTFGIAHFINTFAPGVVLKLNFGEAGRPSEGALDTVTSSADTTTNPGYFTVTSFFDVFTELSLDGGFAMGSTWTVADNDFVPGTDRPGPGTHLELAPVPEPGTLTLAALGLAGAVARFRRRRSQRSAS